MVGSILKKEMFSLKNKKILKIARHGKLLIFHLGKKQYVLSHLGMSGSWRVSDKPIKVRHTHVHLKVKGKNKVFYLGYVDPRRFGYMYFLDENEKNKELKKLGVDISSNDFTPDYVSNLIQHKPNRVLKPFLLDQKFFAGVGNYIACEICAHAGLLPTRKMGSLKKSDAKRIVEATQLVISGSLELKGNTFSGGYVDTTGEKGEALSNLVVFFQDKCGLCQKTAVIKTQLMGRGTYYCPRCQK